MITSSNHEIWNTQLTLDVVAFKCDHIWRLFVAYSGFSNVFGPTVAHTGCLTLDFLSVGVVDAVVVTDDHVCCCCLLSRSKYKVLSRAFPYLLAQGQPDCKLNLNGQPAILLQGFSDKSPCHPRLNKNKTD